MSALFPLNGKRRRTASRAARQRKEVVGSSPLVEITLLHRAMRLELEALCRLAEARCDGGPAGGAELAARFRRFDAVFQSHSSAEDDFIFPALARGGCAHGSTAAAEHAEEARVMAAVGGALVSAAGAGGVTATTVAAFVELKERLSEHMLREEDAVFPRLAEFDDAKLLEIVGLVLGSRPGDVLAATIQLYHEHLEPQQARHVLSTLCAVAKKTEFRKWLAFALAPAALAAPPPPPAPASAAPRPAPRADAPPPCPHYGIRTRVRAPCCGAVVCCRQCHDGGPSACGRPMRSSAVEQMQCASCAAWGPLGHKCASCGAHAADYFCGVCGLLDSTGTPTYHCPYCNVCRRGHGLGIDFHHCMRCNMCVNIDVLETHVCQGSAKTSACASCGADLFATTEQVGTLACGHPAHARCAAAAAAGIGGFCGLCAR